MKNIFHLRPGRELASSSASFIQKHKHHHHFIMAVLALVVAGTGTYIYRHEIASAATFTWTQSSWAGGTSATTATHASNQTNWTNYNSKINVTAGTTVVLPSSDKTITDDGVNTTFATVGSGPMSLAFDTAGNLYTANLNANTVSKVTPAGTVTTFATVGAGPIALAFDTAGNLYTANFNANTVSKVTPAGTVTTFAAVGAKPFALVFDTAGNLYVANDTSNTVSKVTPAGTVTTFATVGTKPRALAFDTAGNLYVANYTSNTVSKVTPAGTVTTFATVGSMPYALAFDTAGNLYTANYNANTVSKVTPAGTVTTFAAVGVGPHGLAFDTAGNLYVANYTASTVYKVTPAGTVTLFAAVGSMPNALAFDTAGNLYTANYNAGTVSKLLINGGFEAGTNSSTAVSGTGSAASVGLYIDGGTGANGAYSCTTGTCSLAGGTYNYTTFNISSGATVSVTGTSPLVIKATGNVTIAGSLIANGGAGGVLTVGVAVAGGYNGAAGPGVGGNGVSGNLERYGGGGGSYGASGGAGGGSQGTGSGGTSGAYSATDTLGVGGGGNSNGGASGYGGASGGNIKIQSSGAVSITGAISANGGSGGTPTSGTNGGGGGGSGGRVFVFGNQVTFSSGTISANGGSGGSGYSGSRSGYSGGGGGGGRVYIYDTDGVTYTGTVSMAGGLAGPIGTGNGGAVDGSTTNGNVPVTGSISSAGVYSPSGTFTSAVINLGGLITSSPAPTLSWAQTLNGGSITMQVRTSADNSTWTGYSAITSGGAITIPAAGVKYVQYKATLNSVSPYTATPTLNDVTIGYTQYALSGNLTSSVYDSGDTTALINNISWTATGTDVDEIVKFQVRSSADGVTWSNWCGPSATCAGADYFTTSTGVVGGLASVTNHPLKTGGDDRYLQYRAYFLSSGDFTPVLEGVTVQYVVNAAPIITNVTASQGSSGAVTVGYDISDSDNAIGNITDVTLQYCTTSCTTGSEVWADAVTVSGDVGTGAALGTGKSITWTPSTDYTPYYKTTQKIRIKANDRDAANNLGYGTSAAFTLDTTPPAITAATLDSSGAQDVVTLTVTESAAPEYRLCNAACVDEAWTSITSGVATAINFTATGSPNAETVYIETRDAYGNTTSSTVVAPATPANFLTTDTTNVSGGSYREFLSWGVASSSTFGSYKVYYNATGAGAAYSLLGTITDVNQNYYTHTITTATSSVHYYKVATVSSGGNVSNFTSVKSDVPDGSGSSDVTAPYIPSAGIAVSSIGNSSAKITFSTYTDISMAAGELATSSVKYASYTGTAPTSCPTANTVNTSTYTVNHSVYLTGLSANTNYVFCVVALDIAGNLSAATSVETVGGTFTTTGGPVITNVTEREITDTSALIFWNTATPADSYVYYSTSSSLANPTTAGSATVVTTAGTDGVYQHQVGLTGLTAGRTYYFKVTSTDQSSNSSTDDRSGQYYSFVTLSDTTPPTITGTSTPVLSSDSAVIVWQTDELATGQVFYDTVSRGGNVAQYERRNSLETTMSIFHIATLSAGTNRYDANNSLVTGGNTLLPTTTYYVAVKSVDAAGIPSATDEWSFTTLTTGSVDVSGAVALAAGAGSSKKTEEGVPPDTTPPTISKVEVSDITPFSAVVKFETDEDTVAFVKHGKDAVYGDIGGDDTVAKSHTIKLRGLTLGTDYHIKATAMDKAGNLGYSTDQTFKTTFLSENLADMAKIENIEQFQKEIEATIESILPSLVPPFVTKPTVSDITEGSATISFKTNIRAFPVVVYAEDGAYEETRENPYVGEVSDTTEKSTSHELALTGLKGNTKYHVQARGFSLPKVLGKSADVTFITKASKIAGSIVERKRDSFTVVWTTTEPTSSIVEFKNLRTGVTERKTDDAKRTSHSMKIENLPSGTSYSVNISGQTEAGNLAEAGSALSVTTSTDTTAPVISNFKVDNALVPGRTDRIQTIVSWITDEPANSTAFYEEGAGTTGDTEELANKSESLDSYVTNHSVILPNLKPGTIYRLKVTSSDDSGNEGSFGPRTVITPKQTESITDIIFKNFEDSFKFLRKI